MKRMNVEQLISLGLTLLLVHPAMLLGQGGAGFSRGFSPRSPAGRPSPRREPRPRAAYRAGG